jgi:hypothetical protein
MYFSGEILRLYHEIRNFVRVNVNGRGVGEEGEVEDCVEAVPGRVEGDGREPITPLVEEPKVREDVEL